MRTRSHFKSSTGLALSMMGEKAARFIRNSSSQRDNLFLRPSRGTAIGGKAFKHRRLTPPAILDLPEHRCQSPTTENNRPNWVGGGRLGKGWGGTATPLFVYGGLGGVEAGVREHLPHLNVKHQASPARYRRCTRVASAYCGASSFCRASPVSPSGVGSLGALLSSICRIGL